MLTKASCHWYTTCRISVHIFFQAIFAGDFHLAGFNRQICAENSSSNSSAVAAVTEVASSVTRKQLGIVDFDADRFAHAVSLHSEDWVARRVKSMALY